MHTMLSDFIKNFPIPQRRQTCPHRIVAGLRHPWESDSLTLRGLLWRNLSQAVGAWGWPDALAASLCFLVPLWNNKIPFHRPPSILVLCSWSVLIIYPLPPSSPDLLLSTLGVVWFKFIFSPTLKIRILTPTSHHIQKINSRSPTYLNTIGKTMWLF